MRRHRRTLMCFSFRAGRASRSESGAYHEREPLLQPVTSRHDLNYSNFGLFLITTGRPNHDLPTVDVFVSFLFRRVTHVIIRKEQESTGVRFHLRRFAIDGRRSKIGARTFDLGQISDPPVVRRAGGRGGQARSGGARVRGARREAVERALLETRLVVAETNRGPREGRLLETRPEALEKASITASRTLSNDVRQTRRLRAAHVVLRGVLQHAERGRRELPPRVRRRARRRPGRDRLGQTGSQGRGFRERRRRRSDRFRKRARARRPPAAAAVLRPERRRRARDARRDGGRRERRCADAADGGDGGTAGGGSFRRDERVRREPKSPKSKTLEIDARDPRRRAAPRKRRVLRIR